MFTGLLADAQPTSVAKIGEDTIIASNTGASTRLHLLSYFGTVLPTENPESLLHW